ASIGKALGGTAGGSRWFSTLWAARSGRSILEIVLMPGAPPNRHGASAIRPFKGAGGLMALRLMRRAGGSVVLGDHPPPLAHLLIHPARPLERLCERRRHRSDRGQVGHRRAMYHCDAIAEPTLRADLEEFVALHRSHG